MTALANVSQAIGPILQVAASIYQGVAAKREGRENSEQLRREAEVRELQGRQQAELLKREQRRKVGEIVARQAISGVDVSVGSPLLAVEEQIYNFERDIRTTLLSAGLEAESYRRQAAGEVARGEAGFTASLFKAGQGLLTSGLVPKNKQTLGDSPRTANMRFFTGGLPSRLDVARRR